MVSVVLKLDVNATVCVLPVASTGSLRAAPTV
jgi:hypothetical protein